MGRQRQLRARAKYDCMDVEQYCPKCGRFNVVRNSRKQLRGHNGQLTNKICLTRSCPGPDKGESCDPPNEAIIKWLKELEPYGGTTLIGYWKARLRRRNGESLPTIKTTGRCVVCEQDVELLRMVFDGKVAGLRCLKHDHHLY